ncbi:hypothetical protein ACFQX4_01645 [Roseomonas sp. GCM10028921]
MELNGALASAGWALADDDDFTPQEEAVRREGVGLWARGARPPGAWQARR